MKLPGFIGPSYTAQSVNVDSQRCINLYVEMDEMNTGARGEAASLVSTPGLTLLLALPASPVRGAYTDSKGQLWAAAGNKVYSVSSLWVATEVGTLDTTLGPIYFKDNTIDVVCVDGLYGYTWDINDSTTFARIVDANFLGADRVEYLDSYFIFNRPGTRQFILSPLNAVTPFSGLDVGTVGSTPADLIGHIVVQENLYLFCGDHYEVWYNSGASSFPFERIQGSVYPIGCVSPYSIQSVGASVIWLALDKDGQGCVYRVAGLQPQKISTNAIETLLGSITDLSGATAWAYNQAGQFFYCLNVPGLETTWCYEMTTGLWHERAFLSPLGTYSRHLAECHTLAFGVNVVGDFSNGNLYQLDIDCYTDNTNPICRERRTPHFSDGDLNRLFISRFYLDMETGVGLDGTGQGTDPVAMLSWSGDGGHSWSNERWAKIGKIGARKARVFWNRLGSTRDRVFRVRITDPIKVTLISANIDVSGGSS